MTTEIRYAVAKDLRDHGKGHTREWWQIRNANFGSDCSERRLFTRKASAMAVVWVHRDQDTPEYYRFTSVKVARHFDGPV